MRYALKELWWFLTGRWTEESRLTPAEREHEEQERLATPEAEIEARTIASAQAWRDGNDPSRWPSTWGSTND